jgi:hypothetical protein
MSQSMPISAADVIAGYIEAKDCTHLQLLGRAFVEGDCEIELADKTDLLSLPSSSRGLEQIAQMLASFGDQYENIRTFCLSRPNSDYLPHFRCDFLVGMNARQDGTVRVGCGQYDWHFGIDDDSRLKKLGIDLEIMCVLPAEQSKLILPLLAALPYPWCSYHQACESIPSIDALRPIKRFLRRIEENKPATV